MGKTNTGWSRVVENKMLYPVLFESELIAEANKYGMGDNVISETFTDGNASFDYFTKTSNIICDAKKHCISVKEPMSGDPTWVNKSTVISFNLPEQSEEAPYNSCYLKIDSTAKLSIKYDKYYTDTTKTTGTYTNYTSPIQIDLTQSDKKTKYAQIYIAFLSPGEIKGIGIAFK